MAQVIRKYSPGGPMQSDVAPIKILGNWYDRDQFRRDALGPRLDKFILAYDLSPEEAANLRVDVAAHIDEIMNGTMTITDNNTIENTTGNWSNNGVYQEKGLFSKWKLSDEDKLNNRSILATNYIINSLNAGTFLNYQNPLKYALDFDKKFIQKYHPGLSISNIWDDKNFWEKWDNLDPEQTITTKKDKKTVKTKKRPVNNRLSHLADILIEEAIKLDTDVNYRKGFSFDGWENNWEGRHTTISEKLRDAAKKLKDGVYDSKDAIFLSSIGVDIDKYINADKRALYMTPVTQQTNTDTQSSNATSNAGTSGTSGTSSVQSGSRSGSGAGAAQIVNGWKSHALPWDPVPLELNYNGKTYVGKLILSIASVPEVLEFLKQVAYDTAIPQVMKNEGFKYGYGLQDMFDNVSTDATICYKDQYDLRNAKLYYIDKNGYKRTTSTFKFEDGKLKARIKNGNHSYKWVNVGVGFKGQKAKLSPVSSTSASKINIVFKGNTNEFAEALINTPTNQTDSRLKQLIYNYLESLLETYGESAWTWSGDTMIITYGNHKIKIHFRKNFNKSNILATDIVNYSTVENKKLGGILKYLLGLPINFRPHHSVVETPKDKVNKTGGRTNVALGTEALKKLVELGADILDTDIWRFGNALVDLSSVAAAFVPGLHIASTAVGASASISDFLADMTDLSNDREGVSFWDSLGRLALNLGMDAISLAPALKTAKGASALRKVAQYVPHIAGVILTTNLIADPELRQLMGYTLNKIAKLDIENLNTQDFRNIAYLGRTLLAAKGITKSAFGRSKAKGTKTGDVEVKGTVKVNGQLKNITARISESDFKNLKKADKVKVAKNALETEANNKFNSDGKARIEEVEVFTQRFGAPATTNVIRVQEAAPASSRLNTGKRVFEGWFGSKGLDWKISDYNLSKNTYIGARIYGNHDRADLISKYYKRVGNGENVKPTTSKTNNTSNNNKDINNTDNKPKGLGYSLPKGLENAPLNIKQKYDEAINKTLKGDNLLPPLSSIITGNRLTVPKLKPKPILLLPAHTNTKAAVLSNDGLPPLRELLGLNLKGWTPEIKNNDILLGRGYKEPATKLPKTKTKTKTKTKKLTEEERVLKQKDLLDNVLAAKDQLAIKMGEHKWNQMSPKERTKFQRENKLPNKKEAQFELGKQQLPAGGKGTKTLYKSLFKEWGIKSPYPTKQNKNKLKEVSKKLFGGTLSNYLIKKLLNSGTVDNFMNEEWFKNIQKLFSDMYGVDHKRVSDYDAKKKSYDDAFGKLTDDQKSKFNEYLKTLIYGGNFSDRAFKKTSNGYQYSLGNQTLTLGNGIVPETQEGDYSFDATSIYDPNTGILTSGDKSYYNINGVLTDVPKEALSYISKGKNSIAGVPEYTINPDLQRYMQEGNYSLTDKENDKYKWLTQMDFHNKVMSGDYVNLIKQAYAQWVIDNPKGKVDDFIDALNKEGISFLSGDVNYHELDEKSRANRTITLGEGKKAKLYWLDNEGKWSKKPGTESTGFLSGLKTSFNVLDHVLLDYARLAVPIVANSEATSYLNKNIQSVSKDSEQAQPLHLRDAYNVTQDADSLHGNLLSSASIGTYSDPRLEIAKTYAANLLGIEAKLKANDINADTVDKSQTSINNIRQTYADKAIQTHNDNVASKVAENNLKVKNVADLIPKIGTDINTKMASDYKSGLQNNAFARKAKLRTEEYKLKATMNNKIALELTTKYGQPALQWYRATYDKSQAAVTEDIINLYVTAHPAILSEVSRIREKYLGEYADAMLAALLEFNTIPLHWLETEDWFTDPLTLDRKKVSEWKGGMYFKSGGKLTDRDKEKIRKVKEFNKRMEADSKINYKTILKSIEDHAKQTLRNSAGTLHLLKQLTK